MIRFFVGDRPLAELSPEEKDALGEAVLRKLAECRA